MEQSEKEDEEFGLGHIIYEIWISHPNGDIQRLSEYTRLGFRRERGNCINLNLWVKNEWTAEKAVIWWDGQGMSEHREIKKSEVLAPRWPIFFTGGNVEKAAKTQDKAVRWRNTGENTGPRRPSKGSLSRKKRAQFCRVKLMAQVKRSHDQTRISQLGSPPAKSSTVKRWKRKFYQNEVKRHNKVMN